MPLLDPGSLDLDDTTYVGSTHWRASANRLAHASASESAESAHAGSTKQSTQSPFTPIHENNSNSSNYSNNSSSHQNLHPVKEAPQLLFSHHHPAYSKRQVLEGLPSRPTADRLVLIYFNGIMLGRS